MSVRMVPIFLAWLFVLGALLVGCRPIAPASNEESAKDVRPLRIVATIRPLELIVRELLEDEEIQGRVDIAAIMAPEFSPHGFEPTAAQVGRLHRADLVIYNGLGLDNWAGRGLPPGVRIVRFEDVVDIEAEYERLHHRHDDEHHEHGPDCDHGPIDEHFWVDPALVGRFARAIAIEVGMALEPQTSDPLAILERPLQRFLARVQEVDARLAQELAPHKGRRIVTHHNVFPRLAERYGLGQPIVLRPLATLEPTPGDLRRAIEQMRAEGIGAILIEPQFSAEAAKRVRAEAGARLIEVDPLGANARGWSDLMEKIGDAILEAVRE